MLNYRRISVYLVCALLAISSAEEETSQDSILSNLNISVTFLVPFDGIDLDIRTCALTTLIPVPCTALQVCVTHDSLEEPVGLKVHYTLDVNGTEMPRLVFLQPEGTFVQDEIWPLDNTSTGACMNRFVFVRPDIIDKLTPIEAIVEFSILTAEIDENATTRVVSDSLTIKKNCGEDDECVPDLTLDLVSSVPTYLIGSLQVIELGVAISNNGEDSFGTIAMIKIPEDVNFVSVKLLSFRPVVCYKADELLLCDVGNPLQANATVQFMVLFEPVIKEGMARKFNFEAYVNSTTAEEPETMKDNYKKTSVKVDISCKVELKGESSPETVTYKQAKYVSDEDISRVSELGPKLEHTYYITNEGITNITEIELRLIVLNATFNGEPLLYIYEEPEVDGNVKCKFDSANPKSLKIDDESSKERRRRRRQVGLIQPNLAIMEAGILSQCEQGECTSIKCVVDGIQARSEAKVNIKTRINARTLKDVDSDSVVVSSTLLAQITKVPFIGKPGHMEMFNDQIVTTININRD